MKRLFTAVAALSLLLCVWVSGVWLYASAIGRIQVIETPTRMGVPGINLIVESHKVSYIYMSGNTPVRTVVHVLGLSCYSAPDGEFAIAVPCWMPVFMTAIIPSCWLRMWRRTRLRRWRATHGCCLHCGYDLRASGEYCPECGQPFDSAQRSAITGSVRGRA